MLQRLSTNLSISSKWHALVFLKWEKFLPRSIGEFIEQSIDIDENQTSNPNYSVWGSHKQW